MFGWDRVEGKNDVNGSILKVIEDWENGGDERMVRIETMVVMVWTSACFLMP